MREERRPVARNLAALAYWLIARHLPWSPRPGGQLARRVRGALAKNMLDRCGSAVNIERGAWFGSGKGIEVGHRSDIGLDCLVIGPVQIGDDVMMGPRCMILAGRHATGSTERPMNTQGFLPDATVIIESDVWIGAGTTILPGRRIGTGSIVGAGSVVAHDVAPWSIVGGNPARVVGTRK